MFPDPVSAFPVGRKIPYGPITVSKEDIIEFAEEFDPISFHVDEELAKESLVGGLCASGFHTCSLTMRMMCDAFLLESTSQGAPEAEEIIWHQPVRPGDTLHGTSTVLSARNSCSRPNIRIVKFLHETLNQNDTPVLSLKITGFFSIDGETKDG